MILQLKDPAYGSSLKNLTVWLLVYQKQKCQQTTSANTRLIWKQYLWERERKIMEVEEKAQ